MITTEEARNQWIEALRSGKYIQTKHYLHNQKGYCCLGVVCDLLSKDLDIHRGFPANDGVESFNGNRIELSTNIYKFLGLIDSEGSPRINGPSLVRLNDKGSTFNEIADELETGKYWRE